MEATSTQTVFIDNLIWATFFLPLFSCLIASLISDRYGWLTAPLTTITMLASVVCASLVLFAHWNGVTSIIDVSWFSIGDTEFTANLIVANSSVLMLFVVALVSFLVHLYSTGYMAGDKNLRRYFAMLGFFTFSMNGIVLTDSLLVMFVFWELVGFSSYLLIGHYQDEVKSGTASKKAFIMNRIGDAGFLVGLMIVWVNTGTFELSELTATGDALEWKTIASLCIFGGVVGKSAQFPLFTWLPDAMQGPTPVSALIHAATMVAAGVYLMVRIFPLFTETALVIVSIVGAITAMIGAVSALAQFDIKKILAYSTMSQLGLMILAIGLGLPNAALLHLFTHAFFKACLFLSAGSVIHSFHHAQQSAGIHFDVQDIRTMGGLHRYLPVTMIAFLISGASLAGLPFFSGFISKEAILTAVWTHNSSLSLVMFAVIISVSFLTVMYTFRMIWFTFFGTRRFAESLHIEEAPKVMRVPIILLAVCSLWFIASWNPIDFTSWVIPFPAHQSSVGITIFSIAWIMLALLASWLLFRQNNIRSNKLLLNAFYTDLLYSKIYSNTIGPLSAQANYTDRQVIDRFLHAGAYAQVTFAHVIAWIDRHFVDGFVNFLARFSSFAGGVFRSFQGGKVQVYIFWATFAIIIFLICALN